MFKDGFWKLVFHSHLIRRLCEYPDGLLVALVQPELDLLDVVGHVLVLEGLEVDGPLVRVPVRVPLLAEVLAVVAVDDGLDNGLALGAGAAGGGAGTGGSAGGCEGHSFSSFIMSPSTFRTGRQIPSVTGSIG